jgi:phospholipid/cholesterol/gamma-HCH transport system substrate-binding protein
MDRRRSSLAANPLLIGALTTLIVAVAVYLSYNALNGLPFTPTYDIKVEFNQANGLLHSNEVRIGGARVGLVDHIVAQQNSATGKVVAIAYLKLEKGVEPLPADTKAIVQSVSALGLKYLLLEKGNSTRTLKPGATIPASNTREPVQIEELFKMFDEPTRTASQQNLNIFGDTFAGRGLGLNETIAQLPALLKNATPVLHNLASPRTNFHELWIALERTAAEAAPVAQNQANLYSDLDTFFSAFASVAPSLEEAIVGGPPALRQAIHSFAFEAPFLEKNTRFFRLLKPSAENLITAAPPLGHAFEEGAVNFKEAVSLNTQLADAAKFLQEFIANPVVTLGLEDLTQTALAGNPVVAGLAPAQTTCNYFTLFFRNIASAFSQGTGVGTLARVGITFSPLGPNAEGGPSSAPANGGSERVNSTSPLVDNNHLHFNPYPNVAGPGQPKVCEAGNEKFIPFKTVIGNVPGATGTTHDETKRSQNLNGIEYPSSTLRDLGLSPSTGKKK